MSATMTFDEQKFRELVLYIASRCGNHPLYGTTKLYKMLFFSDFTAYEKLGRPITAASYLAWEHGPVPDERHVISYEMTKSGQIALQELGHQKRWIALRDPDLSKFSADEIAIVDDVIDRLRDDTAQSVSRRSHQESLGWQAAHARHDVTNEQVVIPYDSVFVSNRKLDEFEEARGLALARKYGWPV